MARRGWCAAVIFLLGCGHTTRHAAVTPTPSLRAAAPAPHAPAASSAWLTSSCGAGVGARLESRFGQALLWNATGTALLVGDANEPPNVLELGSSLAQRLSVRGPFAAIPGRDAFVVGGAVITPKGKVLGDCAVESPSGTGAPTRDFVPLSSSAGCALPEGKLVRAVRVNAGTFVAVFPANQAVQVSGSDETTAWSTQTGAAAVPVALPPRAFPLERSPNGEYLAALKVDASTVFRRGALRQDVLLVKAGQPASPPLGRVRGDAQLAFSASSRWLWAFDHVETQLFDVVSRARSSVPLRQPVFAARADVAVGLDRLPNRSGLHIWRPRKPLETLALDQVPTRWAIDADATRVALAFAGRLVIYDLASKALLRELNGAAITALGFRAGSHDLAVLTPQELLLVPETGEPQSWMKLLQTATLQGVTLSPNGEVVVVPSGDHLATFSLVSGAPGATRPAPSTERATWMSPAGDYSVTGGLLRGPHVSTQGVLLRSPPPDLEVDSPQLVDVAFNPSTERVLGIENLNRPRSSDHRVVEWDLTGQVLWSQLVQSRPKVVATRGGWLIGHAVVDRYEQHQAVFSSNADSFEFAYSEKTDELALVDAGVLRLVAANGKARSVAVPFRERSVGLVYDATGGLLAIGTELGLHVIDVRKGEQLAELELGRVEPLGFRGNVAIGKRTLDPLRSETDLVLLDARSGAWLSLGFAAAGGREPEPYAAASNGRVDGPTTIVAALRGGAQRSDPVSPLCIEKSLIARWLRETAQP